MKLILLAFMVGVALAQEAPAPPAGWFCTPRGYVKNGRQTGDRPCHCKRMDADPICEGTPTESSDCNVYCHHGACQCPIMCTGKS
jgi:hypothetical protein